MVLELLTLVLSFHHNLKLFRHVIIRNVGKLEGNNILKLGFYFSELLF